MLVCVCEWMSVFVWAQCSVTHMPRGSRGLMGLIWVHCKDDCTVNSTPHTPLRTPAAMCQCNVCSMVLSIRHPLNTSLVCFIIALSSCLSLFFLHPLPFSESISVFKELQEGGKKNQIKAKCLVTATARRFQLNYPEILTDACIHSATGVSQTSDNIQASSVCPTFSSSPKKWSGEAQEAFALNKCYTLWHVSTILRHQPERVIVPGGQLRCVLSLCYREDQWQPLRKTLTQMAAMKMFWMFPQNWFLEPKKIKDVAELWVWKHLKSFLSDTLNHLHPPHTYVWLRDLTWFFVDRLKYGNVFRKGRPI